MYRSEFGTDWESLTSEEAIRRAFALGVAESLGEGRPEEYERIRAEAASRGGYDRGIVELAYDEGRTAGGEARSRGEDPESVWEELVRDADDEVRAVELDADDGIPSMVTRAGMLDGPSDDLDVIRLPAFLTERL